MQLALISDLHANVPALEAVLRDLERRGVDRVVCLGDIVDLGPEPGTVIRRLRDGNIPCLMGNHDPFDAEPIVPVEVYAWTLEQLTREELAWLRGLPRTIPLEFEGVRILCVHGSPRSYDEQILPSTHDDELSVMLEGQEFDVLVCGHTHVQLERRWKGRLVVNVGSLGMPFVAPFDGATPPRVLPWAEYAILTLGEGEASVELCQLPYDVEDYFRRTRASSMPDPEGWIASWVVGRTL